MTEHAHGKAAVKTYLLVFGGLALLTGLTVLLSYMHIPIKTAVLLAALISLTKCSLIGAFFMHLRFEGKMIYALLFSALGLVAFLLISIYPDVGMPR
jgi:cytochrome c oxidase subunit IV